MDAATFKDWGGYLQINWGYTAGHVLMTVGAGAALNTVLKALLNPGDEVKEGASRKRNVVVEFPSYQAATPPAKYPFTLSMPTRARRSISTSGSRSWPDACP